MTLQGGISMKVKYKCTNVSCRKKGEHEHRVDLPAEMVMDDRNVADMFCPKCKRKLKRVK